MALEFKVFERAENNLTSLGTVLALVGKDGFIAPIKKNLADATKRVVFLLKNKKGESTLITCSKAVSDGLRNKSITLGNILNFEVMEGESGTPFITMPAGEAIQPIAVKSIKAVAYEPKSITEEELLQLLA